MNFLTFCLFTAFFPGFLVGEKCGTEGVEVDVLFWVEDDFVTLDSLLGFTGFGCVFLLVGFRKRVGYILTFVVLEVVDIFLGFAVNS